MIITEFTKGTAIQRPGFEIVSKQQTPHAQQRSCSIHAFPSRPKKDSAGGGGRGGGGGGE